MKTREGSFLPPRPYRSFLLRCWPGKSPGQWHLWLEPIGEETGGEAHLGHVNLEELPGFLRALLIEERPPAENSVKT